MSSINSISVAQRLRSATDKDPAEPSFDDKVLDYIKQNQPKEKLHELLIHMRELSSDGRVTMQQLSTALLIADATLQKDKKYESYLTDTLSPLSNQLIAVNMMYSEMLVKLTSNPDDDDEDTW